MHTIMLKQALDVLDIIKFSKAENYGVPLVSWHFDERKHTSF